MCACSEAAARAAAARAAAAAITAAAPRLAHLHVSPTVPTVSTCYEYHVDGIAGIQENRNQEHGKFGALVGVHRVG